MDRPYAMPEGVREYLASIEGLHRLREDRRLAGERYERMPAHCVLGRYFLTEDGRFGRFTGVAAEAAERAGALIAFDEFERIGRLAYGARWLVSYSLPAPIAPAHDACAECGVGWTIDDCHDCIERREVRRCLVASDHEADIIVSAFYHVACMRDAKARDRLWWAEDAIERVGLGDAAIERKPGPVPGDDFEWFRVETRLGGIRFGRLAPGFGIDWSETGRDLTGVFCRAVRSNLGPVWNDRPVENGPFHVHPKDEHDFFRSFDRLRGALGL